MVRQTKPGEKANNQKPKLKFQPAGKGMIKALPDGKLTESIEKKYRGKKSYNKMRSTNHHIGESDSPIDKTQPNPVGRPSGYDKKKHPKLAFKFCLLGCSDERLADGLEISMGQLELWKVEHPKFLEAIREGRDVANANVAKSMFNRACGFDHVEYEYEAVIKRDPHTGDIMKDIDGFPVKELVLTKKKVKHTPADVAAAKFFLWNRTKTLPKDQQWNDKQEIDVTSGGEKLASVVVLPPKETV